MTTLSLQQQFAEKSICFGCGPANEYGFQVNSFVVGNKVIAHWKAKPYHNAFPNVLNGGVIGTLLDCHCNWAGAWYLMQDQLLTQPPCTVTFEYTIKLLRPTPMDAEITLEAELEAIQGNRVIVTGKLITNEKVHDTCRGTFVAINESHPAFHRW
jgi:acyl-coenzyme A thioesterase PaaI-like protein